MSKLSFEKVMADTYPAIATPAGEEAYKAYRSQIKWLDAHERLNASNIMELVDEDSSVQQSLGAAAETVLSGGLRIGQNPIRVEGRSFEPGVSIIIAESDGSVHGAYHQPTQNETLLSYGNGLLWAAVKLGDESYAYAHGASTADPQDNSGYNAVCRALAGKDLQDIPFKDRVHLGGSTMDLTKQSDPDIQGPLLHAGVSGVLLTDQALQAVLHEDDALKLIHQHAQAEQADDGFSGNIFAGSIDSTIGHLVLGQVTDTSTSSGVDMAVTIAQFSNGVNVH
ncbi:MAG TPA: hypothetical protein VK983_03645 [Candidatus Limnocylindrales bacterium]|nr:hypothetical protein [Candidatus Limnocylindrales bacterium]